MLRDHGQQVLEVPVGVKAVGLGRFCDAVDRGTRFRTLYRVDHDPVLLSDTETSDGSFRGIVIHGDLTILEEVTEVLLLVEAVRKTVSGLGLFGDLRTVLLQPCKESIDKRLHKHLALPETFLRRQPRQPAVGLKDHRDLLKDKIGDRLSSLLIGSCGLDGFCKPSSRMDLIRELE